MKFFNRVFYRRAQRRWHRTPNPNPTEFEQHMRDEWFSGVLFGAGIMGLLVAFLLDLLLYSYGLKL